MTSLRRLEVGNINLNNKSFALDDAKEHIIEKILPCDALLADLDKIQLKLEDIKKVRNGLAIDYNAQLENKGLVRIYTEENFFVGLGQASENNKLKPKRLLATN